VAEQEGQPTGEAFGFPEDTPAEDLADPLEGLETEEPEAPEPASEEPGEPAPEPPGPEPAEEGEPSQEAPQEEPEQLFAGRYKSVEDLEDGYRRSQREVTRALSQRQDALDRSEQLEEAVRRAMALNEQMAQQLQAQQVWQQQWAQQQGQDYDYGQPAAPPLQPPVAPGVPQVQPDVQRQIEDFRAEMARERAVRDAEQTVADFRRNHPEVTYNGPEDMAMSSLIEDLRLDVGSPEVLELTLEAARDPALERVIRAQPDLMGSSDGIEHAKLLADVAKGRANPQQQRTPAQRQAATQAEAAERARATVLTGGPGTPPQAPESRPKDAIDEVVELYKKQHKRSAFMGG
jgi:hypothetical protein